MDWKKLNVKIEIPTKIKRLIALVVGTVLLTNVLAGQLDYLPLDIYRIAKFALPIIPAIPAFLVFKKEGKKIKDLFGRNILKQIGIGVIMGMLLIGMSGLVNGGYQWLIETSLFVDNMWLRLYYILYYLLVVGFAEEFIYRIVIQEYIESMLTKFKLLAPVLASIAFSLAHLSAGSEGLLVFSFVWGLIWGYLRYFNKHITYIVLGVSHGFYDFGIVVMPYIVSLFV